MKRIDVQRSSIALRPDPKRVLIRPFIPGNADRVRNIIARVMLFGEDEVLRLLEQVLADFSDRHYDIKACFHRHFQDVRPWLVTDRRISEERQLLIGAFFTQEYSLESAALFNPSVVPHPDQSDLPEGGLRIVLSLRAVGEGHISSISFRNAIIDAAGQIDVIAPTRFVTRAERIPNPSYMKTLFGRKLIELGIENPFSQAVLNALGETFTFEELRRSLEQTHRRFGTNNPGAVSAAAGLRTLAESNYEIRFAPEQRLSERVIFPASPMQSNGIEDARFVLFENEDTRTYYATYTAFDGRMILPQLLETTDFLHFRFITLNGPAVQNKGLCLFPRKIGGNYVMLSRQDNENIHLMVSDNIHFWYSTQVIARPSFSWELVQLGNCGSPIETDAGWLILTHGVGPVRKYCLGAFLLDREDPTRVIGRLPEPLITPNDTEREGYVPNVVYTCGALIHNGLLFIPYAMSDFATSFATVPVRDVIGAME